MSFHTFCLCHLTDAKRRLADLVTVIQRLRLQREREQKLQQLWWAVEQKSPYAHV